MWETRLFLPFPKFIYKVNNTFHPKVPDPHPLYSSLYEEQIRGWNSVTAVLTSYAWSLDQQPRTEREQRDNILFSRQKANRAVHTYLLLKWRPSKWSSPLGSRHCRKPWIQPSPSKLLTRLEHQHPEFSEGNTDAPALWIVRLHYPAFHQLDHPADHQ